MKEIELINKRKLREKHFLREDGTIVAKVYNEDIHYLKNGKYEEIDNTLIKTKDGYRNKDNEYTVEFKDNFEDSLMKVSKDDYYIYFKLNDLKYNNINPYKKGKSKIKQIIEYNNIADDVTINYQTLPHKVKETIVLNTAKYNEFSFILNTNLELFEENSKIIAKSNGKKIFTIENHI